MNTKDFKPGDAVQVIFSSHMYGGKTALILSDLQTTLTIGSKVYSLDLDPFYSVLIDEKEVYMFARHLEKIKPS